MKDVTYVKYGVVNCTNCIERMETKRKLCWLTHRNTLAACKMWKVCESAVTQVQVTQGDHTQSDPNTCSFVFVQNLVCMTCVLCSASSAAENTIGCFWVSTHNTTNTRRLRMIHKWRVSVWRTRDVKLSKVRLVEHCDGGTRGHYLSQRSYKNTVNPIASWNIQIEMSFIEKIYTQVVADSFEKKNTSRHNGLANEEIRCCWGHLEMAKLLAWSQAPFFIRVQRSSSTNCWFQIFQHD